MPRGNPENMRPINTRTKEEQKKITTAGGKASVEARRQKKNSKELLEALLDLPTSDENKKSLKELGIKEKKDMTNLALLYVAMFKNGLMGNARAAELILKVAGILSPETPNNNAVQIIIGSPSSLPDDDDKSIGG